MKLSFLWLHPYSCLLGQSPWVSWQLLRNDCFFLQEWRFLINIFFLSQEMPTKASVCFPMRYLCIWAEREWGTEKSSLEGPHLGILLGFSPDQGEPFVFGISREKSHNRVSQRQRQRGLHQESSSREFHHKACHFCPRKGVWRKRLNISSLYEIHCLEVPPIAPLQAAGPTDVSTVTQPAVMLAPSGNSNEGCSSILLGCSIQ